ncbi:MAG: tetratricopeptide repeat protein [Deltaproteobacteria bacterium]|nr:tetratricopeptide repeat protein [Deltaproteobacteria bacterium]
MQGGIKREEAGRITKKLHDCRVQLQKENVYSCLLAFRDVLEKMGTTRMLPADKKQLQKDINVFQEELASSRAFRNLYGPVTFKDDDLETALDFMKQLIEIKEEEILAAMEGPKDEGPDGDGPDGMQQRIDKIMIHVERENVSTAKNMAEQDEEAADALIEMYNAAGIECRKDHDFEKAIKTFKKALFIRPDDEGLYYNLARVYIEAEDWKSARNAMQEALKPSPDFQEGIQLMAFIDKNMK